MSQLAEDFFTAITTKSITPTWLSTDTLEREKATDDVMRQRSAPLRQPTPRLIAEDAVHEERSKSEPTGLPDATPPRERARTQT